MKKRIVCLILTLALTLCVTACGKGSAVTKFDKTISDDTIEYEVFANDLGAYSDINSDVIKEWEKKFNVKLKFEGSGSDWMESLALRINAGDMPDLFFFVPNNTDYMTAYSNFVTKKLIIPMEDIATKDETPDLYNLINADDYSDLKIDGKSCFAPAVSTTFDSSIYVRRDWMDKLGIKDPTTMDDFTAMLKAFTENDPDGNGKKDTYGLAASKTFDWLSYFGVSFGVKPGWSKDDSGTWQLDAFTPQYSNFLTYFNNLYSSKYLKNEFYLYDDSDALDDFYNGKCGAIVYNGGRFTGGITYKMRRIDPNAQVDVIKMPSGEAEGGYINGGGKWWGGWSISYTAKEPMRLAKMLDYFYSDEGMTERLYGIKDEHYSIDNSGNIIPNFEARLKDGNFGTTDDGEPRDYFAVGSYFGSPFKIVDNKIEGNASDSIYSEPELAKKTIEYANVNLVDKFPLNTLNLGVNYAKTYSKVSDRIYTYSIRIIAGNISMKDGMDKMINESKSDGYESIQKIIKEKYGK